LEANKDDAQKKKKIHYHTVPKKNPLDYSLTSRTMLFTEITQFPSSGEKRYSVVQCSGGQECSLAAYS